MANQELLDYLKQFLKNGQSLEVIKEKLLGIGWSEADINAAISELNLLKPGEESRSVVQTGVRTPNVLGAESTPAHSKLGKILSLVVAILILGGGGAYAYYFYSGESPNDILREAVLNTLEVKSSEVSGKINLVYEGVLASIFGGAGEGEKVNFNLNFVGQNDSSDVKNLKALYELKLGFGVQDFLNFQFAADVMVAGNVVYLKPKNLDSIATWFGLMGSEVDLSSFDNKWIKIETKDLEQLPLSNGLMLKDNPFRVVLGQRPTLAFTAGTLGGVDFNQDDTEKIKSILRDNQFYLVQEKLEDEQIDGEAAYHFRIGVNLPILKKSLVELNDFIYSKMNLSDEEKSASLAEMDDFLANNSKYLKFRTHEIWVTKNSKFIKKAALGVDFMIPESGDVMEVDLEVVNSKFNEFVTLEEPKDALSFEDLLADFFGTNLGNSGLLGQSRDSTRISDLATLKSAISLYLADVSKPSICDGKNYIYSSTLIKPPTGWKIGKNSGSKAVDGTGWIPVNLEEVSSGSPIAEMRLDPVNNSSKKQVYLFACDPKTFEFELNTRFESEKFITGYAKDGGDDPAIYETGTSLGFKLIPKGFWDNSF